ncbi:DUF4080 domain-containing protein [Sedimentibacter sp. zth1]|uniref:B12-binding domain-containing radical SAM protein n=1 Tax=Sedimentibacter sp. zth1 TaxID=2816908 RepID=UPI001A93A3C7|nr:B12-binding domain-containing radical SAM protein [Sedimentibacter sp. zth1]QSX07101.1 DUF4080 domain-containing protein [Sedimentibacter sp. zth1]
MKTLLVSIDSKFIHSNLALRYIKNYCKSDFDIDIKEFTINQKIEYITDEIINTHSSLICFSCYIWNIEYVNQIVYILKTAKPELKILLGGPEISFEVEKQMKENNLIDFVIYGEGEISFHDFLNVYEAKKDFSTVKGLAFRKSNQIIVNKPREMLTNLDALISPYNSDETYEDKIVYYESSRGCPFRCSFCMSSIDKSVRVFSMDRVKSDLLYILNAKARQIKFVDRTFNADYKRAMEIMKFIKDNNKNNSSIHFEITADIINDEFLEFLGTMPTNMFQLEIGVQSLNENTLDEINRKTNIDKLIHVVDGIKTNNNMHMHLDLIAGLPYEDYNSFTISFNRIHNLYAEKLQLGFLKVLRGTKIYADIEKHDIKYNIKAPYEIIKNKYLSYEEILRLKNIEELLDKYYNEKYFDLSLEFIIKDFYNNDAFCFYDEFRHYWKENNLYKASHNRKKLYEILYNFIKHENKLTDKLVNNLLIDFVCSNHREELINIFDNRLEEDLRPLKREIAKNKQFREKYFNITDNTTKILNNFRILKIAENIILFVYKDKDNIFERCKTYDITEFANKILESKREEN